MLHLEAYDLMGPRGSGASGFFEIALVYTLPQHV